MRLRRRWAMVIAGAVGAGLVLAGCGDAPAKSAAGARAPSASAAPSRAPAIAGKLLVQVDGQFKVLAPAADADPELLHVVLLHTTAVVAGPPALVARLADADVSDLLDDA